MRSVIDPRANIRPSLFCRLSQHRAKLRPRSRPGSGYVGLVDFQTLLDTSSTSALQAVAPTFMWRQGRSTTSTCILFVSRDCVGSMLFGTCEVLCIECHTVCKMKGTWSISRAFRTQTSNEDFVISRTPPQCYNNRVTRAVPVGMLSTDSQVGQELGMDWASIAYDLQALPSHSSASRLTFKYT